MSKPKAVPMPAITIKAQTQDFITIQTSSPKRLQPNLDGLVQKFWSACLDEALASANPCVSKEMICNRARVALKAILDKGERYCIQLNAEIMRENLQACVFSSKPKKVRSFAKLCKDFDVWWKLNPKMHNARVLIEYL
jgi:hypothetical protein